MLTNRPVIVTQSDPPSSSPPPLQKRGSPYSLGERRARDAHDVGMALTARPFHLELARSLHNSAYHPLLGARFSGRRYLNPSQACVLDYLLH